MRLFSRIAIESDIAKQDEVRERIAQIDILLDSINKELSERKKELDIISGETKKKEAAKKLLDDINLQISDVKEKMAAIQNELGGQIPSSEDIDRVKSQLQSADTLRKQLAEITDKIEQYTGEYRLITGKYNNSLPTTQQIDEIRSILGNLRGAESIGNQTEPAELVPEGYRIINDAEMQESGYSERLSNALKDHDDLDQLDKELHVLEREAEKEKVLWKSRKARLVSLKTEEEQLESELGNTDRYKKANIAPIIQIYENLQTQHHIAEVKKQELAQDALTQEQESLISAAPLQMPDIDEGNTILNKIREIVRKRADIQGIVSRLDGEKSKADSLKTSLDNMNFSSEVAVKEKPSKSFAAALIIAGIAISVLGVIVAITFSPVMIIVTAIGIALAVYGIVRNNKYKEALSEYEKYVAVLAKNEESSKRRSELELQIQETDKAVATLEKEIENSKDSIARERDEVAAWLGVWGNGNSEISEKSVSDILEYAKMIRLLQTKKQALTEKYNSIEETICTIAVKRAEVEKDYPELADRSLADSISVLRSFETENIIKEDKLSTVKTEIRKLLSESGISEEDFSMELSRKQSELANQINGLRDRIDDILSELNKVFVSIGFTVSSKNYNSVFRQIESLMSEYVTYSEKIRERELLQQNKNKKIEALNSELKKKMELLGECYEDREVNDSLSLISEDIKSVERLKSKIEESNIALENQNKNLADTERYVEDFINKHCLSDVDSPDSVSKIIEKANVYSEFEASYKELDKQRKGLIESQSFDSVSESTEETALKNKIQDIEKRRDELLIEYTQKSDFIRSADRSLERFPDVENEISSFMFANKKLSEVF